MGDAVEGVDEVGEVEAADEDDVAEGVDVDGEVEAADEDDVAGEVEGVDEADVAGDAEGVDEADVADEAEGVGEADVADEAAPAEAAAADALVPEPDTAASDGDPDTQSGPDTGATGPGIRHRILAALADGPLDRSTIGDRCDLTPSQTRYALGKLIADRQVRMEGGWGSRNTTYAAID